MAHEGVGKRVRSYFTYLVSPFFVENDYEDRERERQRGKKKESSVEEISRFIYSFCLSDQTIANFSPFLLSFLLSSSFDTIICTSCLNVVFILYVPCSGIICF